ncbi:glycosyltransferase [Actinophytocola oryzae]|uniref:Galactofuranosylgalactofuranosylrhamnosyl-N-acetylglucosaminyl-diphospho-decaprenol beta-1,5/1,6-galactofuranosyltransferase n=1 Tax=Actinophytocola oryzae TaxID=502181 RepID=A0A4R7VMY4_9PSEU|nr:glycosyltransferase [Actinophytocola oryzae]TDV50990.1 galactofuranosylgalactofuranosylrhamnosyl-N-acetylglucosaminyl-diphospho-decaprenol beta-1,5/1,6-galactofuranosyltransferase [Actinophytocola oryzae]
MAEQATASTPDADRVLWRVILPKESDPLDVRPLYIDEPDNVNCHFTSRRQVQVPPSARVSFASYFNAFPASYWKRWTTIEQVTLHVRARGAGRIEIYRSKPNGDLVHLQGTPVHAEDGWQTLEFDVSLKPFEDGGWLWFDVFTENAELEISDACWLSAEPLRKQKMAIGTTTFSRLDDCVAALLTLGEDEAVLDVVHKIYVADQGPRKMREHERYDELVAALGDRLEVIEQGNLGGAGGFTRAFYETLEHTSPGTVDQILLMDDDIAIETDSILRSNMFARAAAKPVIVGSQMLNLQAKSRLHTMGEVVDLASCVWRAAPGAKVDHDFGAHSLRDSPELHKRIDATYNGWWMCLFPREVVEKNGLPLPLFIKCDDAEYSLRAGSVDMPTVTLPGSAVWHEPWTDKNDTKDWTVYFHMRNRLIMAALHSPYDLRKTLLLQGARVAVRRLFSMEYSTAALENKAIEDFMAGPDRLFDSLVNGLSEVQKLRKKYTDAQFAPSAREFPPPSFDMVKAEQMLHPPVNPAKIALRAGKALVHNLRSPDPNAVARPQVNISANSALWFLLGNLDSATVSNADGSGVAFRRRDPKVFRELATRTAANYRRLIAEWPRLAEQYRAAVPELTSVEAWRKVFSS